MKKEEGKISKGRKLIFKILAASLVFLLVFLLEVSLRVLNIGVDYSVFVTDQTGQFKQLNPNISEKYFLDKSNATQGFSEAFKENKPSGTFRLFVMGASTAVGFPYFHNGSFHRMLEYRLQNIFPDVHMEVINTGLTAINSYTLVDFAKAIANENPDAVLIYAGHNEYYGALGVGSSGKLANNPWMVRALLKTRDLRIVQLLLQAGQLFNKDKSKVDLSETLMQRMARDQRIDFNSKKYHQGLDQFQDNMDLVLASFNESKIPVLLATVASNLKDQPPLFIETELASTIEDEVLGALVSQDTLRALAIMEQQISEGKGLAALHFKLGQLYLAKGESFKAKSQFEMAKELDPLRFRAPDAINEIIRNQAAKWDNVQLVDIKKEFDEVSPGGIPGDNLFLEHLHPNAQGYYLIAETFESSMREAKMISNIWPSPLDSKAFWKHIPFTRVDSLYGIYQTWMLREQWPFNEPMPEIEDHERTFEEKIAGGLSVKTIEWGEGLNAMYEHYMKKGDLTEALKITEALILEFPFDMRFYDRVGALCEKMQRTSLAFWYYKRAFEIQPSAKWAEKVFITGLKLDKSEEMLHYMQYVMEQSRGKVDFAPLLALVVEVNSLKSLLKQDSTNTKYLNQIAVNYLQMGNEPAASKYVYKVLQIDQGNEIAIELRNQYQL